MAKPIEAMDHAIDEVKRAQSILSKIVGKQVRTVDAVAFFKSLAYAWFNNHRPDIATALNTIEFLSLDSDYNQILAFSDHSSSKSKYQKHLKSIKKELVSLRGKALTPQDCSIILEDGDVPPDFSPLVGGDEMRRILVRRWTECAKCVTAEAYLASIVMMGGLLEALFVARANKLPDKSILTNAAAAPKDKNGKTINYQEWMLDSYIKVAFELGWISHSAKQLADVLKEYRNYVHPAKELRHQIEITANDASMFWQITKALVRQLLKLTGGQ